MGGGLGRGGAWRGKEGVLEVPIPLSTSPRSWQLPAPPIPSCFPHSWVPIPLSLSPRSWQLPAPPIPSYFPHSLFPSHSPFPPGPGSSLLLSAPPIPSYFPHSSFLFLSPHPPGPGSFPAAPSPPSPPISLILEVPTPLSTSPRSWQLLCPPIPSYSPHPGGSHLALHIPQVLAAPCSSHPLLFPPFLGSHPSLYIPQVLAAPQPPNPLYFLHSLVPIPLSLSPRSWQLPAPPIPSYFPHPGGSHPALPVPQVLAAPCSQPLPVSRYHRSLQHTWLFQALR